MNTVFSDSDHRRISDAIKAVESETSGEIVCVVAHQCEPYQIIAALWATLGGLLSGIPVALIWAGWPAWQVVVAQLTVTLLLMLILYYRPLRMALVPKRVTHRRAHRMARTQFLEQGLHRTEGRTGILIFAAMAEHYVEIIADEGINDRVDPAVWNTAIADFTARMKTGDVIDAFEGAIGACGGLLKTHVPKPSGNRAELPDHLVEI